MISQQSLNPDDLNGWIPELFQGVASPRARSHNPFFGFVNCSEGGWCNYFIREQCQPSGWDFPHLTSDRSRAGIRTIHLGLCGVSAALCTFPGKDSAVLNLKYLPEEEMSDAEALSCLNPPTPFTACCLVPQCILKIVVCHFSCSSESFQRVVPGTGIVLEDFLAILSLRSILTAVCTAFKFGEGKRGGEREWRGLN